MDTIQSSGFYEVAHNFFSTPFGIFVAGLMIGSIILAAVDTWRNSR